MDEVEDPVIARPGPVDEVGPRNRALRRRARPQGAESARRPQLLEIGQQALLHHPFGEPGIHPVDSNDDHLLAGAPRRIRARAQPVVAHAPRAAAPAAAAAVPAIKVRRVIFGPELALMIRASARASSPAAERSVLGDVRRRRAPCRPCSRERRCRTCESTVGRDVDQTRVLVAIAWLQKRIPGTSDGSTQWSPLQAFVFGWKTASRRLADRRLPRNAVAALVADDQVRRVVLVRPAIELAGDVDPLDGASTGRRVDQRLEPAGDLLRSRSASLPGIDDSLRRTCLSS